MAKLRIGAVACVLAFGAAAPAAAQHMYWLDSEADTLERARLEGTSRQIALEGTKARAARSL